MGQRLNNICIVCAAQAKAAQKLMTTITTSDPGPIVKVEEIDHPEHKFIIAEDDIPNHNHHLLLEDSQVAENEHLKPLFILNRIFKIPEESIGDLLVQLGYVTNGVQLCSHCDKRAHQFHQTLQQVSELQRILDEIEKEFEDKIERSKNVPSSFRERIQRCVIMTDSFSELHSKPDRDEHDECNRNQHPDKIPNNEESVRIQTEEVDLGTFYVDENNDDYEVEESDFEPGVDENDEYNQNHLSDSLSIDIEESMIIKTEIVEWDTFDKPLTSGGYTSPSTLLESSTNDNDDDGEVDESRENLPSTKKRKKQEAKVLASRKKLRSVVNAPRPALTIRRKSERKLLQCPSLPKSNRKKSCVGKFPILYKCGHCTHKTTSIATFKCHKRYHAEGSSATACNQCNVFVLPSSQVNHRFHCVPIIQNSLATEENLKLENTGEKCNINHSHPYYITFRRGNYLTKHYQCLQCPYETLYDNRILAHVELHEEGSLAAPCGECGWFLLPEHLDTHQEINHAVEEVPIIPGPSSALSNLKCSECSYECQARGFFDFHLTGHTRQVAESKCKDCGCNLSLGLIKSHKIYCFARATKEAEDTSKSEENLMELVE